METISPTLERLARNQWDAPEVSQQTERRAYRALSLVETMHRMGSVDYDQLASWKRYAWDVEQSLRHAPGVGSYGDRRGGTGGDLDPLDRRITYRNRATAAQDAISDPAAREVVMALARDDMSLTDLARKFASGKARMSRLLHRGIGDLHRHYTGPPRRG